MRSLAVPYPFFLRVAFIQSNVEHPVLGACVNTQERIAVFCTVTTGGQTTIVPFHPIVLSRPFAVEIR